MDISVFVITKTAQTDVYELTLKSIPQQYKLYTLKDADNKQNMAEQINDVLAKIETDYVLIIKNGIELNNNFFTIFENNYKNKNFDAIVPVITGLKTGWQTQTENVNILAVTLEAIIIKMEFIRKNNIKIDQIDESITPYMLDFSLGLQFAEKQPTIVIDEQLTAIDHELEIVDYDSFIKQLDLTAKMVLKIIEIPKYKNLLIYYYQVFNIPNYMRLEANSSNISLQSLEWQHKLVKTTIDYKNNKIEISPEKEKLLKRLILPLPLIKQFTTEYLAKLISTHYKSKYAHIEKLDYSLAILQNDYQGCGYWRVEIPITDLIRYVRDVRLFQMPTNQLYKYNILMISRPLTKEWIPIIEQVKRLNNKFVYETDDDILNIPQHNPASKVYKVTQEITEKFLQLADAIVVSTPYLKAVFKDKFPDKPVFIYPNSLSEYMGEFNEPNPKSDKIKILWAGGASHEFDLEIFREVFELLVNKNYEFIFMGHIPAYAAAYPNVKFYPFLLPSGVYIKKLKEIHPDIVISPLHSDRFARSKSNIKFLEATLAGAITVATDLPQFKNDRDFLVPVPPLNEALMWKLAIEKASDYDFRVDMIKRAQQHVKANYMSEKNVEELAKFLYSLTLGGLNL
ncbi:MAG: hypothetical protein ACP5JE_04700 [Thermoplasmata archaeon]